MNGVMFLWKCCAVKTRTLKQREGKELDRAPNKITRSSSGRHPNPETRAPGLRVQHPKYLGKR